MKHLENIWKTWLNKSYSSAMKTSFKNVSSLPTNLGSHNGHYWKKAHFSLQSMQPLYRGSINLKYKT